MLPHIVSTKKNDSASMDTKVHSPSYPKDYATSEPTIPYASRSLTRGDMQVITDCDIVESIMKHSSWDSPYNSPYDSPYDSPYNPKDRLLLEYVFYEEDIESEEDH
jgi:hypothetical protein